MRKLCLALVAATTALAASAPAGAAVLTLGDASNPANTFSLTIGALPGIVVAQSPSAISGITVSSGTGGFTAPAGIFPASVVLNTGLFTGVSLISSLNLTANNGTGVFAAGAGLAGGFGGSGALNGNATVGVLIGLVNLVIPLNNVGAGGIVQTGAAALQITVTGSIWTTGVAQVTGITTTPTTPNGLKPILNTITLTGYDNRNASQVGRIMLVTPTRILTNAAGNLPSFATLTLDFVPEPARGLLLVSAAAGLWTLGSLRRRR